MNHRFRSITLRIIGLLTGCWIAAVNAQAQLPDTISPKDSADFVLQAFRWTERPDLSTLEDWQMLLVAQVEARKGIGRIRYFEQEYQRARDREDLLAEQIKTADQDGSMEPDALKALKNEQKSAKKATSRARSTLNEAQSVISQLDKTGRSTPANARKKLPKELARLDKLAAEALAREQGGVVAAPANTPTEPKAKKKRKQRDDKQEDAPIEPMVDANPPSTEGEPVEKPSKKQKRKKKPADDDSATTDATVASDGAGSTPVAEAADNEADTSARRRVAFQRFKKDKKTPEVGTTVASYDPAKDVMINPIAPPCQYALERKDEFTGRVYRECALAEVFRYTNPVMKKAMAPGQYHIIGSIALATEGTAAASLRLQMRIQDQNARRTFGVIPKSGILTLKFIQGDPVTLYSSQVTEATYDADAGVATYQAVYTVDRSLLRRMEKNELDQIRVQWSTGYEDYSIQQVDVLQQQVRCLR
jgi:hypothetical protein